MTSVVIPCLIEQECENNKLYNVMLQCKGDELTSTCIARVSTFCRVSSIGRCRSSPPRFLAECRNRRQRFTLMFWTQCLLEFIELRMFPVGLLFTVANISQSGHFKRIFWTSSSSSFSLLRTDKTQLATQTRLQSNSSQYMSLYSNLPSVPFHRKLDFAFWGENNSSVNTKSSH